MLTPHLYHALHLPGCISARYHSTFVLSEFYLVLVTVGAHSCSVTCWRHWGTWGCVTPPDSFVCVGVAWSTMWTCWNLCLLFWSEHWGYLSVRSHQSAVVCCRQGSVGRLTMWYLTTSGCVYCYITWVKFSPGLSTSSLKGMYKKVDCHFISFI